MNVRLYLWQRATAMLLAPLVLAHLVLIIYAVQGGLSAEEILQRTQSNIGWALFYSIFVVCAAVHGGIGLRNILAEWTRLGNKTAAILSYIVLLLLLILGLRAVYAVFRI